MANVRRSKKTLEAILRQGKLWEEPYERQVAYMRKLEEEGRIAPVRASPMNGRRPPLHVMWWLVTEVDDGDDGGMIEEIRYRLHPMIGMAARESWLRRPAAWRSVRPHVRALSAFLAERRDLLARPASVNERSFQIWGDEKFLKGAQGKHLIETCGISFGEDGLNVYMTAEPLGAHVVSRRIPQNVLIVENLDPFWTLGRLLDEGRPLCGMEFGTVAYGGGKRIRPALLEFSACAESYLQDGRCRMLYAGDIDWEGIGIYRMAAEAFREAAGRTLEPFIPAYAKMLALAEKWQAEGRTLQTCPHVRQDCPEFWNFFPDGTKAKMLKVLEAGFRIPQEIMTRQDWEEQA